MSKLIIGTTFVNMDEPCLGLYELNLQSPGSRGFHRYQILQVMRGDKPVEFRRDLGPAKKFKHDQIRIPGGIRDEITGRYYIEHRVGELIEIAERIRSCPSDFDKRELASVDRVNE